jgi:DNA-binding MarR family transcriptional regulator
VVGDLEKRGLVERTVHPVDRRAKIVTVTPAGMAAAEVAERILGEPPAPLLGLAGPELETLDRIVTAMLARYDP